MSAQVCKAKTATDYVCDLLLTNAALIKRPANGDQDSDAQLHVNAFLGLRERKMCFNVRVNYSNDWKQKRSRVTVFADRSTRR